MTSYTLTDVKNRHGEVFDHAILEPVLLTKKSRPSHVILSARAYQEMLDHMTKLEDQLFGKRADDALKSSKMVGTTKFTAELKRIIDADT